MRYNTDSLTGHDGAAPMRVLRDGRPLWLFPDGCTLPVVSGGDGPTTDTSTADTANADPGAGAIFDALADAANSPDPAATPTDTKPDDKPVDQKALVADIVAAVKAEMSSEIDRRINGAERTLAKKFGKAAKAKADPDDPDDGDDEPPAAAKGPDPRDVRDARRTARAEFGERFRAVSTEERDFLHAVLDAKVNAHALSGALGDIDTDATRIATELAAAAKAYREHIGNAVLADLRKRGLLPDKPGVTAASPGAAGDRTSKYEQGRAMALARHAPPTAPTSSS